MFFLALSLTMPYLLQLDVFSLLDLDEVSLLSLDSFFINAVPFFPGFPPVSEFLLIAACQRSKTFHRAPNCRSI